MLTRISRANNIDVFVIYYKVKIAAGAKFLTNACHLILPALVPAKIFQLLQGSAKRSEFLG